MRERVKGRASGCVGVALYATCCHVMLELHNYPYGVSILTLDAVCFVCVGLADRPGPNPVYHSLNN